MERKIKPKNTSKPIDFRNLNSASVLCPICRTILVEPVVLPCKHAFCKVCFEGSMQNTNLVCPLCRLRVASWLRRSGKEGSLVNQTFWKAIQDQFPKEVQNKLAGIDNEIEKDIPRIIVASPGAIRKEYEKERQKVLEEQQKIKEEEEKASATLIQKLQEEEEYTVQVEEEKLKSDLLLARKLSVELNTPSTSKVTPRKRKGYELGPMDRYLLANQTSSPKHKPIMKKPIESNKISILNPKKRFQTSTITSDRACKRQKRDTISPVLSKNYFGKQYTCQVFSVEHSPVRTSLSTNIFADLDVKGILGNLGQKPTKLIESERRKDLCLSGYKSTESNSDVIDQECKFYFKPIEVHRKHHVGGRIPVKVVAVKGRPNQNPANLRPRTKKSIILGSTNSAFARFSRLPVIHSRPASSTVIEPEDESIKIKLPYVNKEITLKEGIQCRNLDKASSRLVIKSPFYGFDTLHINDSIKKRHIIDKKVQHLRSIPMTSLKVGQIIENQIVQLQRNIERREVRKKREKCRDINRNVSEINRSSPGNKKHADDNEAAIVKRKSTDVKLNISKDSLTNSSKCNGLNRGIISPDIFDSPDLFDESPEYSEKNQSFLNDTNQSTKGVGSKGQSTLSHKCDPLQLNTTVQDPLSKDLDETLSGTTTSTSPSGSTGLKNPKDQKKKLIIPADVFDSSSEDEDFSKLIESICNSKDVVSEDSQNGSFTSSTAQNGGGIVKNGIKRRDNRKITDSFSEVKMSPPKGKKVFNSPRRKRASDTEGCKESQEQKEAQEKRDFALAQKLQAEFDLLRVASRTRRGTKRQVTLDKLLTA